MSLFFRSLLVVLGLLWGAGAAGQGRGINTEAAELLSGLTKKPFYASDGWVDLYKTGAIRSGDDFYLFEKGVKKTAQKINKNTEVVSGAGAPVRLGEEVLEYIRNGFKINSTTLNEAFKHIDDFVPNGTGKPTFSSNRLVGCHNEINFNAQRVSNGGRIEVISETPSGVAGVKNVEYKTLQLDNSGNPIAGLYVKNGESHVKTVYDPAVYPEATMKDLGYKSFKDAMDKNAFNVFDPLTNEVIPRTFKGSANGRTIMGHYKIVNGENIISSWWIIQ
jgi:hypothetical protein